MDADCLSRKPLELSELMKKCTESVEPSSVAAVLASSNDEDDCCTVCNVDVSVCELSVPDTTVLHVSKEELVQEQESDEIVGPVRKLVLSGEEMTSEIRSQLPSLSQILWLTHKNLKMVNGLLVRDTGKVQQLV